MGDTLVKTAFDAKQRERGGTFAEWEGWDWIADFGDPLAEHHAVRQAVGVWDESPLQKWMFTGADALRAADYCFSNDMLGLQVGQIRYGAFCDENGKMLGDGTVYNSGPGQPVLVVTALASDGDHFRRITSSMDVAIEQATDRWPHVQVQGPRSRELVDSLCDADVTGLGYFRFFPRPVMVAGIEGCWVSRTGYSGETGYEIYVPAASAERLWDALMEHGADHGIRPYGLTAVESLRIESGLIFIGYDYFAHQTSPWHMSLDKVIRLDTGDFHGKAALAAEKQAGVTHRMVTLVIEGDESPDYGTPVLRDGAEVGTLLSPSGGESPSVKKRIGMACIQTPLAKMGERMHVTLAEGTAPARVDSYPIYDPDKTRTRS